MRFHICLTTFKESLTVYLGFEAPGLLQIVDLLCQAGILPHRKTVLRGSWDSDEDLLICKTSALSSKKHKWLDVSGCFSTHVRNGFGWFWSTVPRIMDLGIQKSLEFGNWEVWFGILILCVILLEILYVCNLWYLDGSTIRIPSNIFSIVEPSSSFVSASHKRLRSFSFVQVINPHLNLKYPAGWDHLQSHHYMIVLCRSPHCNFPSHESFERSARCCARPHHPSFYPPHRWADPVGAY